MLVFYCLTRETEQMKRQLLLALGCLMLLGGWLGAFLLNSVPQSSTLYILGPTLLLGIGMGLMLKTVGGKLTALTLALTALTALLTLNQIFPSKGVGITAFQKPAPAEQNGTDLVLEARADDREGLFAEPPVLESFAPVEIRLFSRLPSGARMLLFDPQGNLYVSLPHLGAVYLLQDRDGDGFAEQPLLFHAGMDRPHGLAWLNGNLYVAETTQVLELRDSNGDHQADRVRTVLGDLPDDGGHWTRSLAAGRDGLLYLSIGSRCNACEEQDPRRATVLRVDPQTGRTDVFARGLRNSVGLTFSPNGNVLWGSDNGRDMLGDDLPPDEINRIVADQDYGWPYCYGKKIPDPTFGSAERCETTVASAVDLQAHSAPLGIAFGTDLNAPEGYRNSLYVAYHGSWNRIRPTGYKIVRIPFADGEAAGDAQEFMRGWLRDGKAWGRPVAPAVGPDGNLYISDDRADAIYRIHWTTQE